MVKQIFPINQALAGH